MFDRFKTATKLKNHHDKTFLRLLPLIYLINVGSYNENHMIILKTKFIGMTQNALMPLEY